MTHDNPIDWFQETMGGKFPEKMEALLKLMAGNVENIEMAFTVPKKRWRRFNMLDFKSLHPNMKDPAYTLDDNADRLENPYFLVQEINERCNGIPRNILPFAGGFNEACEERMFAYFKPNDSTVYVCNINTASPVDVLAADVEELLGPIDSIFERIDKRGETWFDIYPQRKGTPFVELITEEKRYINDAECTYSAKGYEDVIENLMGITDGLLTLESFTGIDGNTRTIQVTINGISGEFSVAGNTHYLDSAALIRALNALLEPVMEGKFFIDTDETDGQFLEVAFGDQTTYELLLKNQLVAEWQMKKT
jgi:hypothetical protein